MTPMCDILLILSVLGVVASFVGIGVLCALLSPWFISLSVVEGLALGWVMRDA